MGDVHTCDVLNPSGHLRLQWDPDSPEDVAQAEAEIERLRTLGYRFFAVIGDGAVSAGGGALLFERVESPIAAPVPAESAPEAATESAPVETPETMRSRRGKAGAAARARNARTVAVAPMRGG